jgi:hypothetical protein
MRLLLTGISLLLVVPPAHAQSVEAPPGLYSNRPVREPFYINWGSGSGDAAGPVPKLSLSAPPALRRQAASQPPLHAAAVQHSDAYETRRKIHKYASFATLPLFAAEFALGQSLYNDPQSQSSSKRGIH